jgi:AraC-like DNA-binding protein
MKESKENQTLNDIILNLLQETESKNYSYKSVASKCHMSTSTFFRKIKKLTGYTPANFVNYLKIQQARQILDSIDQKKLTLRDIAFQLNYTDSAYFSRVFKKYIGISPSNYRDLTRKDQLKKNVFKINTTKFKNQEIIN